MMKLHSRITATIAILIALCGGPAAYDVTLAGKSERISSHKNGAIEYLSVSELAELFGERISWEIIGESARWKCGANVFVFFIGSPYVRLNDSVVNVTYPLTLRDGALFAPAMTFVPLLEDARGIELLPGAEPRKKRFKPGRFNVHDVSVEKKANGLLIELFVSELLDYQIHESEGNWINVNLNGARVDAETVVARKSSRELLDVNVYQFEQSAQVSLRLRKQPQSFRHKYDPDLRRLQISILEPDSSLFMPDPEPQNGAESNPAEIGPARIIEHVVIDAGHGGEDFGAIGRKGTREKDVCLDIAQELARLIREEGLMRVTLTRDRDIFVPLEDRARIANTAKANLFVSIHANASVNRNARGSEVFFLAPAKTDASRALAQAENAAFLTDDSPIDISEDAELNFIVNDMIQNVYEETSSDLSAVLSSQLRVGLSKVPSRGVDQAGFVVLDRVYMPAALVETAFISNKSEESLLKSQDFRKSVALALYEGLKQFKLKYDNK